MAQNAGLDEVKGIPASATGRPGPAGPNGLLRQSPEELLEGLAQDQQAARLWESLLAITPSRRRERVRDLGERRDPRARKLLAAALWDEETAVALAAVEGLRGLGDSHSAESLAWLAEISRVERAAAAARAAIEEIHARSGAGDGERPELADGREYWASFIDGAGSQLLAVDLNKDGVTLNDSGDADTGDNNLQNFPVLSSVTSSGGMTTIAGNIHSTASTTYRIEFFSTEIREPGPDLVEMIGSIGSQLGQFIERKEAEEAVRESESRKTGILENALDCIVLASRFCRSGRTGGAGAGGPGSARWSAPAAAVADDDADPF